jgi:hypothetical protein
MAGSVFFEKKGPEEEKDTYINRCTSPLSLTESKRRSDFVNDKAGEEYYGIYLCSLPIFSFL